MFSLEVKPSSLPEVYWSHTFNDLKVMVRMKMEFELARANQEYENLILTASAIFGGKKKSTVKPPETLDEAIMQLARMGIG